MSSLSFMLCRPLRNLACCSGSADMTSSTQMSTEWSGGGCREIACHRLIYLFCSGIWSYISCCDVFKSYPHVTSSSCHFMLLVTVSHTRMRCCMSDSLRVEIRACVFQVSHRIYPITHLTTGIWSESGASHESFSHACQITCAYSHSVIHSVCPLCLHVQSLYCVSLCMACTALT